MKCSKCGNENDDSAKFCKHCGEKLETGKIGKNLDKDKKIIIGLVAIIVILLVGAGAFASGILTPVKYETQNFEGFTVEVPEGQEYLLSDSVTKNPDNVFLGYINKNKYYYKAWAFQVGNNLTENKIFGEFQYQDGDVKIYKNETDDQTIYLAYKDDGNGKILVYGSHVDIIKHIANSFKSDDLSKLASGTSSQTTPSSTPSSSTPSSISILGGSFSTGSADEDKTYARINVGTAHAGENVIVQIFYSRNGNSLNNGNMVPATVHSDGYLEIASAEAYKYYPDYATINIYDSNSNLLATRSVSLMPAAGTQTF